MSFTFSLSDPQLNPLTLRSIATTQARPYALETQTADTQFSPPTLSPMSSRLFHRRDRQHDKDLKGTTDHLIDARHKKHVEDAFISSQLVELGLLDPRHAIGKQASRAKTIEIVNGTGESPAYPKKSESQLLLITFSKLSFRVRVRRIDDVERRAIPHFPVSS